MIGEHGFMWMQILRFAYVAIMIVLLYLYSYIYIIKAF